MNTDIIEQALTPLWKNHHYKQMLRALAVWKTVFDFAQASGFDIPRTNPARWRMFSSTGFPFPRNRERKSTMLRSGMRTSRLL